MKLPATLFLLISFLSACGYSAPKNNRAFEDINELKQLEGVYLNKGEGGTDDEESLYLSKIIWPYDHDIYHEAIDKIEVKQIKKHSLLITAIQNKSIIKTAVFTN